MVGLNRWITKSKEREIFYNLPPPFLKLGIIALSHLVRNVTMVLSFSVGVRLENYAWCIMPNHVHWVFRTFEKDDHDQPVYLSDIMESVKKHTSIEINKLTGRKDHLWQKESFDTTIRDNEHLYHAINYTLNNLVTARFVKDWQQWPGCWKYDDGCGAFQAPE